MVVLLAAFCSNAIILVEVVKAPEATLVCVLGCLFTVTGGALEIWTLLQARLKVEKNKLIWAVAFNLL